MFIRKQFRNVNNPDGWHVAVLAPTGLAAYNINGQTIHRFFKLPVNKDTNETFWELSDNTLKVIRELLPNCRLFMIG